MIRLIGVALLMLLPLFAAQAESPEVTPKPGDVYQIERISESAEQGDAGAAASSYDRDTLVERVIAVRDAGMELEYDLPNPTAQDREIMWQFPARVFRPAQGPLRLLNASELQARADHWLKRAKMDRIACGHWAFTWTAIRIECDPQSAIAMIEAVDFGRVDLDDGAPYRSADARAPAPLVRKTRPGGTTFSAELAVDADKIRRDRAEADLVTAEILRKPLTRDDAVRSHAGEDITGTISIAFDVNPDGQLWRRTTVTKTAVKGTDGKVLIRTTTETITRRLVSGRKP